MNREQILQKRPPKVKPVEVPEWGGTIHIRVMTGAELDGYDQAAYQNDYRMIRAELLVRCLCDEQGNRILSDQDVAELAQQDGYILDRLFDEAREHNGMTSRAKESIAKN